MSGCYLFLKVYKVPRNTGFIPNSRMVFKERKQFTFLHYFLNFHEKHHFIFISKLSGEWEIGFDKVLGQDLRDSTVGIVGLGGIGQAVVKRLAGFEVSKFIYSGHREKPEGMYIFYKESFNWTRKDFN